MPVSAEFATLCQSQIALMAQAVGADSTAVYLAERVAEQALPKLVPVAIYPTNEASESPSPPILEPDKALPGWGGLAGATATPSESPLQRPLAGEGISPAPGEGAPTGPLRPYQGDPQTDPASSQQLAIPLMHEGGVMGVLVSWRADRPWRAEERNRLEDYARVLTLACALDQRGQWLKTQLSALNQVQSQQSDRFHELLHQLRSPLTALKTFGKLLAKRLTPDNQNQSLVASLLRESDRLQELLGYFDDTLKTADRSRQQIPRSQPRLAAIAPDHAPLKPQALPAELNALSHFGGTLTLQPCLIEPLVTPLVASTQALAEAADKTLHVFPPTSDLAVVADARALVEILSNFLDNALKYSLAGTRIWLQWGLSRADQPTLVGLVVGDTGPGIPQVDQPHIFERHYRGVQASGPRSGSGLGLAIARDLVHEMQGSIDLYSPLSEMPWPLPEALQPLPQQSGTVFVIWLPRAEAP